MVKGMKWYIVNEVFPLCWYEKMLEFDTEESAKEFLEHCYSLELLFKEDSVFVEHSIRYYDEGSINATAKTIVYDEEKDDYVLIEKAHEES